MRNKLLHKKAKEVQTGRQINPYLFTNVVIVFQLMDLLSYIMLLIDYCLLCLWELGMMSVVVALYKD